MIEELARHLFDMQADDYGAGEAMRELAWADQRIVEFWVEQAKSILDFIDVRRDLRDPRD